MEIPFWDVFFNVNLEYKRGLRALGAEKNMKK